jgi:hypothetical protein
MRRVLQPFNQVRNHPADMINGLEKIRFCLLIQIPQTFGDDHLRFKLGKRPEGNIQELPELL